MGYRYLDDFRRGISVFAIFSYGIAVLGTPQCPPRKYKRILLLSLPPTQLAKVFLISSDSTVEQLEKFFCIPNV